MADTVRPIPEGYEGATPYLCCRDAAGAIDFYKKAFGQPSGCACPCPMARSVMRS